MNSNSQTVVVPRSLAERTEAMFRSVDPTGNIAIEWKRVLSEPSGPDGSGYNKGWNDALTRAVDACNKLESFGKEDHRDSWMGNAVTALDALRKDEASSEAGAEHGLRHIVEYRRKPEHRHRSDTGAWVPMAAFDYEAAADGYVKQCSAGDPPWEYRVRPQPGATEGGAR